MNLIMRILNVKMVCPKCKKEYINHSLASYSSGFKTPAKNFLDNNKPTTHCENCNIKLVKEKLINYFDDIGCSCWIYF